MTFEQAIDFFREHGNVTQDRDRLIREKPTSQKLLNAVEYAVLAKQQPVRRAAEAMLAIVEHDFST